MLNAIYKDSEEKMKKALQQLDHEFGSLRTGRASMHLLDDINVQAYGTAQPLKAVASLSTPDAHTILITPWDKNQVDAIEKAILASNIGLTPNNDGSVIRLNVPPLTEERRMELVKLAHKMAEDARVAIRNIRRGAKDAFKKLNKDKKVSDDEQSVALDEIQERTDKHIKKIDEHLAAKEKDIMEI